ncbi:NAD(P)-binding protein [Xylaria telfairii]|nr:NAD(P)-binding protein [Xylaria telfairii]
MPSYVITGVSRGLGWEFLKKISSDPSNSVIGIVRNKPLVEKRVAEELDSRRNITLLRADVTKYDELKTAAADVASITGGSLDYLIANAAYLTAIDTYDGIGTIGQRVQELSDEFHKSMEANVLANIHLYNIFMPLILQGTAKKVVAISSGIADIDWINDYEIAALSLNSMSKAALNVVTAKFNAQYKKDGVLFLSVCPGFVDTGHFIEPTPEQQTNMNIMMESYMRYSPSFKGPITPTESIEAVLSVIENASIEKGDGGRFLSHFGNKKWL